MSRSKPKSVAPRPSRQTRQIRAGAAEDKKDAAGPRHVERLLGIFREIARAPEGRTLAELSALLDSPKSTLLTLLRPLVAGQYLVHVGGRYSLGNESFVLGTNILSARKFGAIMRSLMTELQAKCPETIILATMDRASQSVTYTDVIESPQLIRYSVPAGSTRPLFTSAAGQLLLAMQGEEWRERYLRSVKLVARTRQTITDAAKLREKLNSIRRSGFSVSISEAVEGATGVAAPIFAADGSVVAALLIAGPTERYNREGRSWSGLATEFSRKASRAIGFSEPLQSE